MFLDVWNPLGIVGFLFGNCLFVLDCLATNEHVPGCLEPLGIVGFLFVSIGLFDIPGC